MSYTDRYILNSAGEPEPCEDLMTWAIWFENGTNRVLARTQLPDGREVSTVFLGLDHSFGGVVPVLWETMVFGGDDDHQQRYTSRAEAEAGHAALVRELGGTH